MLEGYEHWYYFLQLDEIKNCFSIYIRSMHHTSFPHIKLQSLARMTYEFTIRLSPTWFLYRFYELFNFFFEIIYSIRCGDVSFIREKYTFVARLVCIKTMLNFEFPLLL